MKVKFSSVNKASTAFPPGINLIVIISDDAITERKIYRFMFKFKDYNENKLRETRRWRRDDFFLLIKQFDFLQSPPARELDDVYSNIST